MRRIKKEMSDEIEFDIKDNYNEHSFHDTYDSGCSECYKKNRTLRAWETVNRQKVREQLTHDGILERHPGLKNPYGSNYPTGYVPE